MSLADVYLVFDRYYVSSIKRQLQSTRAGVSASRKHILNDQSPLPPQKVVLNVTENKSQLIKLVCQHLRKQCDTFPADKKLVVTEQDPVPFEINKGMIIQRSDLRTTHEEADVIIIQQLLSVVGLGVKSVKIICDDTDVFVLLVHYYIQENLTCELIMCGTSASRSVTDVKATAIKHASIANQLLPAHALSGCDTVSQLYGIGKGTVLKVVNSNVKLNTLGQTTEDLDTILRDATKFIACCYGSRENKSMSDARYEVWTTKMANKRIKTAPPLKTLPPTTEAFRQHVLRAHLQAAIWRAALKADPPDLSPVDFVWSLDQATKCFDPIHLPSNIKAAPADVLEMTRCGCVSEKACSNSRCGCYSAHLPCSIFCACHGDTNCHNPSKCQSIESDDDNDEDELAVQINDF